MLASIGDVIVRGGMPYRDGWDMKGPLAYYGYALAQWLFGRHMWSIRILDIALLVTGMAVLASVVGRLTSRRTGWWAAIVFAFWIASLTWFHAAQPDGWVAVFIILAAAPLVGRRLSIAQLALSGFLIGCAALVKPPYLGFLAVPLIQLAEQSTLKKVTKLALAASAIAAALVPPLLAVAWFAHRGALRDLVDVHLLYPLQVYSGSASVRLRSAIGGLLRYFLAGPVTLALPIILIGAHKLWHKSRHAAVLLITWAMVAVACVAIQGKFFKYHWIPLFPPLVILGTVGFYALLPAIFQESAKLVKVFYGMALSFAALAVLQLAIVPASSVHQWLQLMTGRIGIDQYYAAHVAWTFVAENDIEAASYIRTRTQPAEGVTVWGNNALIGFLSGRANPTRFVFALPLTVGGPGSIRERYRREYLAALLKNPPAYFVVGMPWESSNKELILHGFPELEGWLHSQYAMETRIGGLDLYRRHLSITAHIPASAVSPLQTCPMVWRNQLGCAVDSPRQTH